jgi:multidrug resistance efflux pump
MEDLTQIELSDLYDLLAQQTNRYMKMLSEGATKQEFDQCREIIIDIQAEIQSRKNQQSRDKTASSNTFQSSTYTRN